MRYHITMLTLLSVVFLSQSTLAESYNLGSRVGGQYSQLVSVPESCGLLKGKGLIVARSSRYDIVYAYDSSVAKECCLAKVPIGQSSFEKIVKKACIHHGQTGWSVNVSSNHYMKSMKIYLPGHKKELDAYYFALHLITN